MHGVVQDYLNNPFREFGTGEAETPTQYFQKGVIRIQGQIFFNFKKSVRKFAKGEARNFKFGRPVR